MLTVFIEWVSEVRLHYWNLTAVSIAVVAQSSQEIIFFQYSLVFNES